MTIADDLSKEYWDLAHNIEALEVEIRQLKARQRKVKFLLREEANKLQLKFSFVKE